MACIINIYTNIWCYIVMLLCCYCYVMLLYTNIVNIVNYASFANNWILWITMLETHKGTLPMKVTKITKLWGNHPILGSAAQIIHKTDNANISAIHLYVAKFSILNLWKAHLDLFNLGLSFCTTPMHINPAKVCYDDEQLCRRLRKK